MPDAPGDNESALRERIASLEKECVTARALRNAAIDKACSLGRDLNDVKAKIASLERELDRTRAMVSDPDPELADAVESLQARLAVAVEALRKIASTSVQTKTGKWYMDRANEALAKIEEPEGGER
jgi:chromosome segregation ATPase